MCTSSSDVLYDHIPQQSRGWVRRGDLPIGCYDHYMPFEACTEIETSNHPLLCWILDEVYQPIGPISKDYEHLSPILWSLGVFRSTGTGAI